MAKFLILVDRPAIGDKDCQLKDGNGRYVWHLLFSAYAPMHDLAIEFLIDDQGYNRWRSIEAKHKPTVVVAMGQVASDNFDIDGKVAKTRGSVYERNKMFIVPTFHPQELKKPYRMFLDESLEKGFYTGGDIRKAVKAYHEGWNTPEERFNIEPTIEDLRSFVATAIREKYLLGTDLEATGLNIEHVDIVVMGFAWTESDCIVIPILAEGGKPYWSKKDWPEVSMLLNKLFAEGLFMFQNGVGYDIPLLRARGWKFILDRYVDETMVMHHTINPELPHNIGFISSVYGKQPYWKDVMKDFWGELIFTADQKAMRIYNARDCVALHQIRNAMEDHMDELIESDPIWDGIKDVYQQGMKACRAVIEMQETGILLDPKKVTEWHKYVEKRNNKSEKELTKLKSLPAEFNLGSGDHLSWLLYGVRPPSWGPKYEKEFALYNESAYNYQYECEVCGRKVTKKLYDSEEVLEQRILRCPVCKTTRMCKRTEKDRTSVKGKSKESKNYLKLLTISNLLKVEPLYRLHGYSPPRTKSGEALATDKPALVRYTVAIDSRLSQLKSLKRPRPSHELEGEQLAGTRNYILVLQKYLEVQTLMKNFWSFPTWLDGKVRPSFLVTGTATGRFSCKKPNLQQVPSGKIGKIIRSCFRAEPGCQLLSVDFSNLEVQIGARVSADEDLIKMLEAGANIHDINTQIFFGVTKSDPKWKVFRDVAKIIVFARIWFGGSDNGIYSQVMTEVPDCGLTLPAFKVAVQNYFKAHPAYITWADSVTKLATERKLSVNAFGRVRSLLGPVASIKRQALNSPVQGSAADTVRDDLILVREAFNREGLRSKTILQIHDELVFSIRDDEFEKAGTIVQKIMNRERTVNGYTFRIPIDAEVGRYWGDLSSINLETFEIEKGSKH